jgi:hypothetical protein
MAYDPAGETARPVKAKCGCARTGSAWSTDAAVLYSKRGILRRGWCEQMIEPADFESLNPRRLTQAGPRCSPSLKRILQRWERLESCGTRPTGPTTWDWRSHLPPRFHRCDCIRREDEDHMCESNHLFRFLLRQRSEIQPVFRM